MELMLYFSIILIKAGGAQDNRKGFSGPRNAFPAEYTSIR